MRFFKWTSCSLLQHNNPLEEGPDKGKQREVEMKIWASERFGVAHIL